MLLITFVVLVFNIVCKLKALPRVLQIISRHFNEFFEIIFYMSVKERLTEFVESLGISKSEFGRQIGVSNAFISSIRKSIQQDKIQSIASKYPNLNIEWLLTGEGEMLKTNDSVVRDNHSEYETGPKKDENYYRDQCDRLLRTIENNSILMLKLQEENERLRKELDEKFQKSNAHEAGAGCAAAG